MKWIKRKVIERSEMVWRIAKLEQVDRTSAAIKRRWSIQFAMIQN